MGNGAFHEKGRLVEPGAFAFLTFFYVYSWLMLLAALQRDSGVARRRSLGIVVDLGCAAYGLCVTGSLGSPLIALCLWIPIGNGFRFGHRYTFLAMACSLMVIITRVVKKLEPTELPRIDDRPRHPAAAATMPDKRYAHLRGT